MTQKDVTLAPFSEEAEQSVIGAILVNADSFLTISATLRSEDFYLLRNSFIWDAFMRISNRDERIDYVTVLEELRTVNQLDGIGGSNYLLKLANNTPSAYNAESYAQIVKRAAIRRRLLAAADEIKILARNESMTIENVQVAVIQKVDDAVSDLYGESRHMTGPESLGYYAEYLDDLIERVARGEVIGVPLPKAWAVLRESVPAVYPGEFVIVSGQSGGGKSAFMESWAEDCAAQGVRTHYIHTEMTLAQMFTRRMSRNSGIPYYALASGDLADGMYQRGIESDQRIKDWMPFIAYEWMPSVKFALLAIKMRRAVLRGAKVLFVDHFQDIQTIATGKENPVLAAEQAVTWLAGFAEARGVIVIVASQENADGATKWTKKLTEMATIWLRFERERLNSEYAYQYKGVEVRAKPGEDSPVAEVFVNKARFGKKAKFQMCYHGPAFKWLDMTEITHQQAEGNIISIADMQARQRASALKKESQ